MAGSYVIFQIRHPICFVRTMRAMKGLHARMNEHVITQVLSPVPTTKTLGTHGT